jgi:hypothetical protein
MYQFSKLVFTEEITVSKRVFLIGTTSLLIVI